MLNAGIGILLIGLGAVGIENISYLGVSLGKLLFGFEVRHRPTAEQEHLAIETSADSVTRSQEHQAETLVSDARTRNEGKRSASDLLLLATAAWRAKQFDTAIDFALRGLHLEPPNVRLRASLRTRLASTYDDLGATAVAERLYRQAILEDPDFAPPHNNLGDLQLEHARPEEAIASFRMAIQLDPEFAFAYNNLGFAIGTRGDDETAINSFHTAIQLDPTLGLAWANLGVSLRRQGKVNEADAADAKARELGPLE